jgi:hypothetical protein
MILMSDQSIVCSRGEQLRHGGSSVGRLQNILAIVLADVWAHSILNGFFFRTKKTVSINSRYFVR